MGELVEKIEERLRSVEEHIIEGKENRRVLIDGFKDLKESVSKLEHTVFGNGDKGMVHKVDDLLTLVSKATSYVEKILWLIATVIIVKVIPSLTEFLFTVTHQLTGK